MSNALSASPTKPALRVLFFGMECTFSLIVLKILLEYGIDVCAVVLPAPPTLAGYRERVPIHQKQPLRRSLHTFSSDQSDLTVAQFAPQQQLPVWEVADIAHEDTIKVCAEYNADLICVACFSQIIPASVLQLPRMGCLNVHPSLLPKYRGPLPLFWVLRYGEKQAGVTIHYMEQRLDSGDILAQEAFELTDGMRYAALETQCAQRGGELLARAIQQLAYRQMKRLSQDEEQSSYQSFPRDEDYIVYPEQWGAGELFRFVYGIASTTTLVEVYVAGERYFVRDALAYSLDDGKTYTVSLLSEYKEDVLEVRCRDGVVTLLKIRM